MTNIKGLPKGPTYFTEYGYSESYPWVEVRRTAKTVVLAKVRVTTDPEWIEKGSSPPADSADIRQTRKSKLGCLTRSTRHIPSAYISTLPANGGKARGGSSRAEPSNTMITISKKTALSAPVLLLPERAGAGRGSLTDSV